MTYSKELLPRERAKFMRTSLDFPTEVHSFYKSWAEMENISFKELILKSLVYYIESTFEEYSTSDIKSFEKGINEHAIKWDKLGAERYTGLPKDITLAIIGKLFSSSKILNMSSWSEVFYGPNSAHSPSEKEK